LNYKGIVLDCGYSLEPIHEAQMQTYLKLRNAWLGLIINFNVIMLKDGVRRLVNG